MSCSALFFLVLMIVGCMMADWILTMKDAFFDERKRK